MAIEEVTMSNKRYTENLIEASVLQRKRKEKRIKEAAEDLIESLTTVDNLLAGTNREIRRMAAETTSESEREFFESFVEQREREWQEVLGSPVSPNEKGD
jgi:hypothetical protein